MVRSLSSASFVGRKAELARLQAAFERAAAGEASTVLLAGEAGVGKTRLLSEFLRQAETDKAQVLLGGCIELGDVSLPYAPVVEALRGLSRRLPDGRLAVLAGPGRADLARLLPELGGGGGGLSEAASGIDSAQLRLFEHVLGLIERLSRQVPLVLAIEDLHWSDRSTRDLLAFLVHSLIGSRVLLIGTYRSDELNRTHPLRPLLARFGRDGRVERIDVPPFDRSELAELLSGLLCETPDTHLVEQVYERSEGNPFFAEELVAASPGTDPGDVPATLRDVLLTRIDALPAQTKTVLGIAAAAGREVDHELLAAVAGLPPEDLLAALRVAVGEHVLVAQPDSLAYRFHHALVAEAVHDDLLPGERIALHARLARVLEERPELSGGMSAAGALAWHWFAAQDQPRALAAALEAARIADQSFAYAEAQRHLERALELWTVVADAQERAGTDLAGVLKRAAAVANRAGDHQRAEAFARQALALVDPDRDPLRAGLLQMLLATALSHTGLEEAEQAMAAAVRIVPAQPPTAARARVLNTYAIMLLLKPRYESARLLAEEAVAVARQAGAGKDEVDALISLGVILAGLGEVEAGMERFAEARSTAEADGNVIQLLRIAANVSDVLAHEGELERAVAVARDGAELAGRYGLRRGKGAFVLNNAIEFLLASGRWDEAEPLLRQALAWESENLSGLQVRWAMAELALGRGDIAVAREALAGAQRHRAATGHAQFCGPIAAIRAELALREGRYDEAREIAAAGLDALAGTDGVRRYSGRVYAVALRAEADRPGDAGSLAVAAALRDRLRTELESPAGVSPPFRAWALLAEAEWCRVAGEDRAEVWAEAAEAFEVLPMPYRAAYARMREGAALLAADDRSRAAVCLRGAWTTAERLGAAPLRADVERLARHGRVTLAPDSLADGPMGLTPREVEVLRLVAEGRTNRQIGQALFISGKTASVHVSNILAKLGVASRGEAAALAHRLDLVDGQGALASLHERAGP